MNKVTIVDVAKEVNLSIATVSYVLNNKKPMPEETRKKVLEAAKKLGYSPSYTARSLVTKRSNLIGIVIPQTEPGSELLFKNPFYAELLSSIEYYARKERYQIIISGTDANEDYLELANQRNLDGIIVVGIYPEDIAKNLDNSKIPIVFIDSFMTNSHFSTVNINDRYAGFLATNYLIEHGHRKIAYISGSIKEHGVNYFRYNGYLDALTQQGIPKNDDFVFTQNTGFEGGELIGEEVLKNREITACFCSSDIMALGLLKSLLCNGVKVGEDVSVIGFDNLNISSMFPYNLTTIKQDIFEKGKVALELLIEKINDGNSINRHIVLPVTLVERTSVKKIN